MVLTALSLFNTNFAGQGFRHVSAASHRFLRGKPRDTTEKLAVKAIIASRFCGPEVLARTRVRLFSRRTNGCRLSAFAFRRSESTFVPQLSLFASGKPESEPFFCDALR